MSRCAKRCATWFLVLTISRSTKFNHHGRSRHRKIFLRAVYVGDFESDGPQGEKSVSGQTETMNSRAPGGLRHVSLQVAAQVDLSRSLNLKMNFQQPSSIEICANRTTNTSGDTTHYRTYIIIFCLLICWCHLQHCYRMPTFLGVGFAGTAGE